MTIPSMGTAWNNWFHVTIHVYGSWLRGDPRGWRSQNHREHVDGDYKNPPPGAKYTQLYELSKSLMKREPVRIGKALRAFVVEQLVEKLEMDRVQLLAVSVDTTHVHVLARFNDWRPRHWIGRAKKHASHVVRQAGLRAAPGGLWAKRSLAKPITGRAHQVSCFEYIIRHQKTGAAVWTFRDRAPAKADG